MKFRIKLADLKKKLLEIVEHSKFYFWEPYKQMFIFLRFRYYKQRPFYIHEPLEIRRQQTFENISRIIANQTKFSAEVETRKLINYILFVAKLHPKHFTNRKINKINVLLNMNLDKRSRISNNLYKEIRLLNETLDTLVFSPLQTLIFGKRKLIRRPSLANYSEVEIIKILWQDSLNIIYNFDYEFTINFLNNLNGKILINDSKIDYFNYSLDDFNLFIQQTLSSKYLLTIVDSNSNALLPQNYNSLIIYGKVKTQFLWQLRTFSREVLIGYSGPSDGDPEKHRANFLAKGPYLSIDVFYGTDRASTIKDGKIRYGIRRSEKKSEGGVFVHYGICKVSIPYTHTIGVLESNSLLKLEFKKNPNKHVTVLHIEEFPKTDFIHAINKSLRSEKDSYKHALLFVHGYNVSFENAAQRTAQIYFDLEFKGLPIFYSWPSQAKTLKYPADEASIEWSRNNLELFLEQLLQDTAIDHLYLIAHSMGSRALTRAVTSLLTRNSFYKERIKEIILAAPDIDTGVFLDEIVPAFALHSQSVTLYASSNDRALLASKLFHGYSRAGQSGKKLIIDNRIETVDASSASTSLYSLNHSYFSSKRTILSDMAYIINQSMRAGRRFGLELITNNIGQYWKLKR